MDAKLRAAAFRGGALAASQGPVGFPQVLLWPLALLMGLSPLVHDLDSPSLTFWFPCGLRFTLPPLPGFGHGCNPSAVNQALQDLLGQRGVQ